MTQQPDPQQPQADQQPAGGAAGEGQPQVIAGATGDGRGFIVGPQGMAVERAPGTQGEEPAKVRRIGNMIRALLEEVRSTPLYDPSRERLREVYGASIDELKSGLSEDLAAELERITEPFTADETPSTDELRIAKAQLVGWLEGLFQGIQTALVAQQMAARAQLEQMRRTLPGGPQPGQPQAPQRPAGGTDGMYL